MQSTVVFQNLEADHSLARSSPGSQPEQHANRRIVAKPLEASCESCDFVQSDAGSQVSAGSKGSKKFSYAKSKSRASMESTFVNDDRVASPQEQGQVDAPDLEYPASAESNVDFITNESTAAASETVPAEKEGDIDFYPSKSSAEPSLYNRSIDDRDPNDFKESHPTQLQCTLQSIDDEESSEEEQRIVQLDDSRNNMWIIQPKAHKRKSSTTAQEQFDGQYDDDQYEYEPDDGTGGPKRRKISKPDSGIASQKGRSVPGNARRPIGAEGGARSNGGVPVDRVQGCKQLEQFEESSEMEQPPGSKSILGSQGTNSDNLGGGGYLSDEVYVDTSLKRGSHDLPNFALTPINEERTKSQSMAELSGNSFHSCDENGPFLHAVDKEPVSPSDREASDHFESPQLSFKLQETGVFCQQLPSKSNSMVSTEERIVPQYQALDAEPVPPVDLEEQVPEDNQNALQACNSVSESAMDRNVETTMSSFALPINTHGNQVSSSLDAVLDKNAQGREVFYKSRDSFETSSLNGKALITTYPNMRESIASDFHQKQNHAVGLNNPDLVQQITQDSMLSQDSTGIHSLEKVDVAKAGVGVSADPEIPPRFSVEDPKASTKDKCIIKRQAIPPIDVNENIEEMTTPRFGPSAELSLLTHNLDRSEDGLIEANNLNVDDLVNKSAVKNMQNAEASALKLNNEGFANHNVIVEGIMQKHHVQQSLHARNEFVFRAKKGGTKNQYERQDFVLNTGGVVQNEYYQGKQVLNCQHHQDVIVDSPYPKAEMNVPTPDDYYHQPNGQKLQVPVNDCGLQTPVNRPQFVSHMSGARCVFQHDQQFSPNGQFGEATPVPGPITPVYQSPTVPHRGTAYNNKRGIPSHPFMVNSIDPNYSIYIYDDHSRSIDRVSSTHFAMGHHMQQQRNIQSIPDAFRMNHSNNDLSRSRSSHRLCNRRSPQNLSDGMSSVSQSFRGSNFVIDMRPDSTHSLNLGLQLEKSLNAEKEIASSVPATPNMRNMSNASSIKRLRSTTFKPLSSSNRGLKASARNFVATPMTSDIDLASPREGSLRHILSSQSLERQIR